MFHANGWGLPFTMTGLGVPQVVLRKVDGAEILRRVEQHGVTVMCAAPAVAAAVLEAAAGLGGRDPRPRPGADHHGRRAAADEDRGAGRGGARLGVRPDLRADRDLPAADDQPDPRRSGTTSTREERAAEAGAGRRARARRTAEGRRVRGGRSCWPAPTSCSRATGSSRRSRPRRCADGWFHTGDGAAIGDDGYLTIQDRKKDVIITGGENVSSIEVEDVLFSHPAVAEVAVIGVPEREVGRDDQGAGRARRGRAGDRGRPDRLVQGARRRATRRRRRSSSATSSRGPRPASCRSSSCASSTGRATTARSTEAWAAVSPATGETATWRETPRRSDSPTGPRR